MLPRYKSLGVLTMMVACCLVGFVADVSAQTKMDSPKQAWAQVPGGTVWLNPGDAYEHSTGLVRDRNGVKRYPTTPQSVQQSQYYQPQQSPVVAPAVPPYQPTYQPYVPPNPYVQPGPFYGPPAPQPVYYPAYPAVPYYASQVDYGPYLPPNCWNCPNASRAPSTQSWGVRGNPMDQPKTGDAPRLGDVPRGADPPKAADLTDGKSVIE